MKKVLGIVIVLCSSSVKCVVDYSDIILPTDSGVCSDSSKYFDSSQLSCLNCPYTPQTLDKTSVDGVGNSFQCTCPIGYTITENDCSKDSSGSCLGLTCNSCFSPGVTSYSDNTQCVPCSTNSTIGVGSNGDCVCQNSNYVLVEKDMYGNYLPEKVCGACATGKQVVQTSQYIAGKYYTGSNYLCQSCPDPLMTMTKSSTGTYSCSCPSGYTLIGVTQIGAQSCAINSLISTYQSKANVASVVNYFEGTIGLTSLTFQHYFVIAASRCTYYGQTADIKYCQILANLCVLQQYDATSQACIAHSAVISDRGNPLVYFLSNWVYGSTWLYIKAGDLACINYNIQERYIFNAKVLEYTVASYSMNGTFLGFSALSTLFAYCTNSAPYTASGGGESADTVWLKYGHNYKTVYKCELSALLTANNQEQVFYEVFQTDGLNYYPKNYYANPVRIVNLKNADGSYPNILRISDPCASNDVLVRRFYLYDIVSGITSQSASSSTTASIKNIPQVLRYASSIILETYLVKNKAALVHPTVITIQYTDIYPSGWTTDDTTSTASVSFEAYYPSDLTNFFATTFGFFIAAMLIFGAWTGLRYYYWNVRITRIITQEVLTSSFGGINFNNIFELLVLGMSTWVLVFFPFQLIICWYFLLFFKVQTLPSIILPPQVDIYNPTNPYYGFVCNLHVMALFQLVYALTILVRQCNADLFFIDWEPQRNRSDDKKTTATTVSVWRSILVANEYAEMQTIRKTDIRWTLFFMGLLLVGVDSQYTATQQPNLQDLTAGPQNIVLRFGNTTFLWLVFSYAQYMWKLLIYERFITESPERLFVDFCTIAKISLLVLDEKYHGYYLHCRSPHQYADGTMMELMEMLNKEEAGLTSDRSLDDAPPNVQCFQIFVTGEWRAEYDKIANVLKQPPTPADILNHNRNRNALNAARMSVEMTQQSRRRNQDRDPIPNEAIRSLRLTSTRIPPNDNILKAWRELSTFLQEFIENNFSRPALRRIVREPTYFDKMVNSAPPLITSDQPCIFYPDRDYYYSRVLLLGREHELLLMNILTYSLFDLWFNSTLVSIFLCYLLDWSIRFFRQLYGEAMITKRTLIDHRFLI